MTIDRDLLAEASMYGITLTTEVDPDSPADSPSLRYIVVGPLDTAAVYQDQDSAAADIRHRIDSILAAADAATRRAEQWQENRRSAADDITAWRDLAAEVDALLPAGCTVPVPDLGDPYGLSGWPSMTGVVADALAAWSADARDAAGRRTLDHRLDAEGSVLLNAAEQIDRRADYWDTVVELWRPIQLVREPGDSPKLRRGRVLADTGTRRIIAWRHFGVIVAVGREQVDAAADQLDRAREVVAAAADRHRDAADRLAGGLRL
jgi:hypothetical protein